MANNKKFFLSYKFSEQPIETLHANIDPIVNLLSTKGVCYCNLYDEPMYQNNKFTTKQIIEHALSNMDETTLHVTYINSTGSSEGMLIEYAVAKQLPRLLLIHKNAKCASPRSLANTVIDLTMKKICWQN